MDNADSTLHPIKDDEGRFLGVTIITGEPIILDFSQLDREIMVSDNSKLELGKEKKKNEIKTINELQRTMVKLTMSLHKAIVNSEISVTGIIGPSGAEDIEFTQKLDEKYSEKVSNSRFDFQHVIFDDSLIHQLMFDVLYDKYLMESPLLTLNQYCEKHIDYYWDDSIFEKEDGLNNKIKSTYKWMIAQIEREVRIKENPALKEDSIKFGRDPDEYISFLRKLNPPFGEPFAFLRLERKPKTLWDYIYYSGNPDLITSKQFRRNFNRKHNNNKFDKLEEKLKKYDEFVQYVFIPIADIDKGHYYYEKSMDFYHLEIYKRIDFIYKLAVVMEDSGLTSIDRSHFLVKRFTPPVLVPYTDNDHIQFSRKRKYYRPLLFIEEQWQRRLWDILAQADNKMLHSFSYEHYLFRAMVYELFKYHYKFNSSKYYEIADFIHKHYNILAYHDPNKEWIQDGKEKRRDQVIRIKNAIEINNALF